MLTVNLEKKLIKQNKILITPEELLILKEYETLDNIQEDNEILERVGLNYIPSQGKRVKSKIDKDSKILKKYSRERTFHISQIESLCKKYYLRFLKTKYYKGSIDSQTAIKISNFEAAYNTKCDYHSMYIAAPKSSFKLEEKPKDPLLFYQITGEYYYLIHKWGNDISIFRRLLSILSRGLTFTLIFGIIGMLISLFTNHHGSQLLWGFLIGVGLNLVINIGVNIKNDSFDDYVMAIHLLPKNNWDSIFKS